jgi:hypothetical protein
MPAKLRHQLTYREEQLILCTSVKAKLLMLITNMNAGACCTVHMAS